MENQQAEKIERILTICGGRMGLHPDLYYNETKQLKAEGKIVQKLTFTATGNRVYRWVLA
jgi:hypothetical protein